MRYQSPGDSSPIKEEAMRHLTAWCWALFAPLAIAALTATTASAILPLPEVHIIGGASSAELAGEISGPSALKMETALGAPLTATSAKIQIKISSKLTSSGTGILTILGVKQGTKEC